MNPATCNEGTELADYFWLYLLTIGAATASFFLEVL